MSTTTINERLMQFCGATAKHETRYPFVRGDGRLYYTDGAVIVRVPTGDQGEPHVASPPAEELMWPEPAELQPWPCADYEFLWTAIGGDEDGDDLMAFEIRPGYVRMISGELVQARYHYLISLLPGIRYMSAKFNPSAGKEGFYFRFDGGEGILLVCDPTEFHVKTIGEVAAKANGLVR